MSALHTFDFQRAPRAFGARKARAARFFRVVLVTVGVATALFAAAAIPAGLIAASVASRAALARQDLEAAQKAMNGLDIGAAVDHVGRASTEIRGAHKSLRPLLPFAVLPYVGPRISAADALLEGGERVADSLSAVLESVRSVVAALGDAEALSAVLGGTLPEGTSAFKDLTPERKRDILAALADLAPKLRQAVVQMDAAISSIDDAATVQVAGNFDGQLAALRGRLLDLRAHFAAAAPLAELLPPTLGYPSSRRYLLFFQNNTELRPTGGFLGIVALLTVKDAEIASLDVHDVYYYDGPSADSARPAPPEPIRKYIGIDKWFLRDANWSPDFAVASDVMERFFREEDEKIVGAGNVPQIDGTIAFTPQPAADVLRLIGPVTVDGVRFDADNLVDQLEFQVEQNFAIKGVPVEQRKDIVGALVQEIVRRVTALRVADLQKVASIAERNLAERQVLVASHDPSLQAMVLARGWGGTFRAPEGDTLLVVDANLASLKTDPAVHRTVQYAIAPDGSGGFIADTKITYRHTGHFDWKTTRYRTYTRLYAPAGSAFLSSSGAMADDKLRDPRRMPGTVDVGAELGRAVFGAFISIEPGETRTLEFRYRLPVAVARQIQGGRYLLDVEKQSGTPGSGLQVDLDFGKKLSAASPPEDPKEFGDTRYRYDTDLRIDRHFEITL